MLAAMIEIQELVRPGPAVGGHVPNPSAPVTQHQPLLGSSQAAPQGFPVQSLPQFHGLTVPAHHRLLSQNPSLPLGMCGLLLQVENPRLDFVPLHPLLLGFLLTPAGTAKSPQPTIHQ